MKHFKTSLLVLSTLFAVFASSAVFAQNTIGTDLTLTASLPDNGTQIAQYANATLNVSMVNKGTNGISGSNISP